jgi:hypothetical protein
MSRFVVALFALALFCRLSFDSTPVAIAAHVTGFILMLIFWPEDGKS